MIITRKVAYFEPRYVLKPGAMAFIMPAFGRQRQVEQVFKASPGYIVRACLKDGKERMKRNKKHFGGDSRVCVIIS